MKESVSVVVLFLFMLNVALSCRRDTVQVDVNNWNLDTLWERSIFIHTGVPNFGALRQVVKPVWGRSDKVAAPPSHPVSIQIATTHGNPFDLKRTCVRAKGVCTATVGYEGSDGSVLLREWNWEGKQLSDRLCCATYNGCILKNFERDVFTLVWNFYPCEGASQNIVLKDMWVRTCWSPEWLPIATTPTLPTTTPVDVCIDSSPLTVEYDSSFQSTPVRTVGDVNAGVSMCEASLYAHNSVRMLHQDTPLLVYDDSLAATAEHYAMILANNSGAALVHSPLPTRNGAGENMFWGRLNVDAFYSPADATLFWYNEAVRCSYDYTTGAPADGGSCGIDQFTQVVWNQTVSIGCGAAQGNDSDPEGLTRFYTYHVCHYSPGNLIGQNAVHVHVPRKSGVELPTNSTQLEAGGCVQKSTLCGQYVSLNFCTSTSGAFFMAVVCPCDCP